MNDFDTAAANGLAWATSRWQAEVSQRPIINVHRRTLDDTWRQVVRYFEGDPDKLLGPAHDELIARAALATPAGVDAPVVWDYVWLIELRPAFDGHPAFQATYYAGWKEGLDAAKTVDPNAAPKFARKEDAERVAAKLGHTLSCVWTAIEHGFARAAPTVGGTAGAKQGDYCPVCGPRELGHRKDCPYQAPSSATPVQGARMLTDEQIDRVLGDAYLKLVKDTGYNGGMGGVTWDRAAARAIEAEVNRIQLAPTGAEGGQHG